MISRIFHNYCSLPHWTRRPLWKWLHGYVDSKDRDDRVLFMNYGYSNDGQQNLTLQTDDEPHRYCIQLYHHIVSAIDIAGLDMLEVGCGRGGGASYVTRYLNPRSYIGLDQSVRGTAFCQRYHNVDGLTFVRGDAQDLPFEPECFDAVVNVESSRCYGSMERFLAEVHRVLRPGGYLLFGDNRENGCGDLLASQFEQAGLRSLEREEITARVVEALDLDHERRQKIIREGAPRFAAKFFGTFAAVRGSKRYEEFATGKMKYWRYLLKK